RQRRRLMVRSLVTIRMASAITAVARRRPVPVVPAVPVARRWPARPGVPRLVPAVAMAAVITVTRNPIPAAAPRAQPVLLAVSLAPTEIAARAGLPAPVEMAATAAR